MGDRTTTEKSRFEAVSESGERRVIVEFQHWRSYQPLNGPPQKLRTSTELFTDDGLDVNDNRDGTFTVLQTDEVLRKVDKQ